MNSFVRSLTVSMVLLLLAGQALSRDGLRSHPIDDRERAGIDAAPFSCP